MEHFFQSPRDPNAQNRQAIKQVDAVFSVEQQWL